MQVVHFPYLSIDHLKMGLIRSGHTTLTPESADDALTDYLWPIVREIREYADVVEKRLDDRSCTIESVCKDNARFLERCQAYHVDPILIDEEYQINIILSASTV